MSVVLARPASECSHRHFIFADFGDNDCACAPPGLAEDSCVRDSVHARVASTYQMDAPSCPPAPALAVRAATVHPRVHPSLQPIAELKDWAFAAGAHFDPQRLFVFTPLRLDAHPRQFTSGAPKFAEFDPALVRLPDAVAAQSCCLMVPSGRAT